MSEQILSGFDLVEHMIKIAAGHKLEVTQNDIKINGHAIEYRLYAEDPARKFLPSIGFLTRLIEPAPHPNIRIDTGVQEGSEISMYYDPMISKLIVWGPTREDAIATLHQAVDDFVIKGVIHNSGFCKAIISNDAFYSGNYSTAFIGKYFKDGYKGMPMDASDHGVLAITAHKIKHILDKQSHLAGIKYPEYNNVFRTLYIEIEEKIYKVTEDLDTKKYCVEEVGSKEKCPLNCAEVDSFDFAHNCLVHTAIKNSEGDTLNKTIQFLEVNKYNKYKFFYKGSYVDATVYDEQQFAMKKYMAPPVKIDFKSKVLSPMPGAVVSIAVKPGDTVVDGQELCILEAMKMQNMIKSEREGKIKDVKVKKGQSVAVEEILIEFE